MKYFSPHVLDGSITSAKLAGSAVVESKLASGAVWNRAIRAGAVTQLKLDTAVDSLAGTIGAGLALDIALTAYAFWPMLHVENPADVYVTGHIADGGGADFPRLALFNTAGAGRDYDLDYRYVESV